MFLKKKHRKQERTVTQDLTMFLIFYTRPVHYKRIHIPISIHIIVWIEPTLQKGLRQGGECCGKGWMMPVQGQ